MLLKQHCVPFHYGENEEGRAYSGLRLVTCLISIMDALPVVIIDTNLMKYMHI
jgi:hypothetical protein